ncbi:gamma-glutamylcyclotransferase [Bauldia sp.]|uniref:gamma-glutamylcyclotransferase n=1 Tax=Bauldia sp. TaxID=2575872 RepID=UPI003BAC3DDC
MSDFWVFGYGSLMWRPGFPHRETVIADLPGAHRALCVYSWVHRGTRERPGLVLGLDRGGSCRGVALRVAANDRDGVIGYLRDRELVTDVYREVWRPVRLHRNGPTVKALTFVVDRGHRQYAGRLPPEILLAHVRGGHGRSGANREYIINTVDHLRALGIRDNVLEHLAAALHSH